MGQCFPHTGQLPIRTVDDSDDSTDLTTLEYEEMNDLNSIGGLSPHSLNKLIVELYLSPLPDELKALTLRFLQGVDTSRHRRALTLRGRLLDLQYPFNSTILSTKEKYSLLSLMQQHLRNRSISFKLIYRASQDGYGAKDYHRKCDRHDYTVHIIEPRSYGAPKWQGPIFGGFTSIAISDIEKEHRDPEMILFRVRSDPRWSEPLNKPDVYHSEKSFRFNHNNYVCNYTHSCISFGTKGMLDAASTPYLFVSDRMHVTDSYVANDRLTKWTEDTMGFANKFRIQEMEVFQLEQLFVSHDSSSSVSNRW